MYFAISNIIQTFNKINRFSNIWQCKYKKKNSFDKNINSMNNFYYTLLYIGITKLGLWTTRIWTELPIFT